ncbi:MAG: hypothetical protein ACRDIV_15155 [Ktedonobacteraceae bacterium]
MDALKSLDARTVWQVNDDGTLTEAGADCLQFTRSAIDTEILLTLLKRHEDLIHKSADRERGKLYGRSFKQLDTI